MGIPAGAQTVVVYVLVVHVVASGAYCDKWYMHPTSLYPIQHVQSRCMILIWLNVMCDT